MKFPFQRYIIYWGKFCRSKIIGGGDGGEGGGGGWRWCPEPALPLFRKTVYLVNSLLTFLGQSLDTLGKD